MIWHLIRYWLTFFIPLFYKKIGISNGSRLAVNGPVIIAMNHPNAFADSIIISYVTFPIRLKYLARGDAFKPGLISFLLDIIGIIPIYRIQDGGKEGLHKNDSTYKKVNSLLKKNAKLIVFAEGICIQERRLKPLKKGVARMVFGAFEAIENDQLVVVPVGINYDNPSKFRSTVFYNVGEPLYVKDFFDSHQKNPTKTNKQFLEVLENNMKALITQTKDKKNDDVVLYIEALCKKDWLKKEKNKKGNLEPEFIVTKKITDLIFNILTRSKLKSFFKISNKTKFELLKYKYLNITT
jgi:1-acyl-sn-glycerol-3-phosphate acyltransferase